MNEFELVCQSFLNATVHNIFIIPRLQIWSIVVLLKLHNYERFYLILLMKNCEKLIGSGSPQIFICASDQHYLIICRKILNIILGLIDISKRNVGGLYSWGLTFGQHFVLASTNQELMKCQYYRQNSSSLSQNHLDFVFQAIYIVLISFLSYDYWHITCFRENKGSAWN